MKAGTGFTLFVLLFLFARAGHAQEQGLTWSSLPPLPDSSGFAGMFAGVVGDRLICMGGANFPGAKPWQGGSKRWYDHVYLMEEGRWTRLPDRLPAPGGYGVSVSWQHKIILVGGSNASGHSSKVYAGSWEENKLRFSPYPDLPWPLANMSGALVGNLLIVSGGSTSPTSGPMRKCLALDLEAAQAGWFELDPWPGPERLFPVSASYAGRYYLFSGETTAFNQAGQKQRHILQDAYCLTLVRKAGKWQGSWKKLPDMPKGTAAGPSPAPYMINTGFVFWGGVDRVTALYPDPATHPGISQDLVAFNPESEGWHFIGRKNDVPSRVTLPAVFWKNRWVFLSGEIRPGIRTNSVYSLQ